MKYTVYVDDNFHYMDESERCKLGEFHTAEAAITAARAAVDRYLFAAYETGMTAGDLYESYMCFGEDPYIVSDDRTCTFSARDYARERCQQLCRRGMEGNASG